MKPLYRIILFILICWFGYTAFRQTLGPQKIDLFYLIQHFNLVVLTVLFIVAVIFDVAAYRKHPKFFQFFTSLAALFLGSIVILRLVTFNNIEKSKTLYKALSKTRNKNNLEIQFKEKGFLRMKDLMSQVPYIYYGRYYINKDTITIFQINYEGFADSLPINGIIKEDLLLWKNGDTMWVDRDTETSSVKKYTSDFPHSKKYLSLQKR